jgi:hypothetical protein
MGSRPKKLVCIYQDDEYGQSGNRAVIKYAAERGIAAESVVFRRQKPDIPIGIHLEQLQKAISDGAANWRGSEQDVVVVIVAFGQDLKTIVKTMRAAYSRLRLATTTSIERDELKTGDFDGLLVPYSFYPQQFSVYTLEFFKYMNQARAYYDRLLPGNQKPIKWPEVSTIHAEVHDGTIFWFNTFVVPGLSRPKQLERKRLYVTDFVLRGEGTSFGNYGSLYMYQIIGNRMVPVQVED